MKKTLVLILILFVAIVYGAQITSISPTFQDGQVIFRIDTDVNLVKDNIFVEKNAAGSLISIHLRNVNLVNSPFFLPVAYGPVDSLRAIGTYQGSLILFQLLIPKEPSIEIVGKTLKVAFKGSDKRIDLVLTEGSNFETAVKFLAEELNLNVVLSDTVKTAKLALKLSNITPEEALRNLLFTVRIGAEPLAYSYMPDGTLHIGTKKEISERFAQFWGIYEVSEDIVQKIEKILSPTTIMTYLPNKALLFVYGDLYEQELISKILSVAPPSVTREITVSMPVEEVSKLLSSLKRVYTFEFNLLEGLDKFIITGDSKTIQTVISYVSQLEDRFKRMKLELPTDQATKTAEFQAQSRQFKVTYPQEASKILEIIGLQALELPFGILEAKGSEVQLQLAESVLRDLGFTDQIQVELLNIPKPIQEKVISAISTVFGIPASRFIDLQEGLFVIAPLEIRNSIKIITSELTRFYYTLKQSEIFFLNDEQTAAQVSQILNQIYGIGSTNIQNILKITGSEEDLNKAKTFLKTFVKDRLVRTVDVTFDDQVYTEVKTLIESTFDVRIEANLKSLRTVIISSYNQNDLQKAVEELQKIYSSITPIVPNKVVKPVPVVEGLNFEDAKLLLSKLYEVDIEKTNLFYIIKGEKDKLEEAERFLNEIGSHLQTAKDKFTRIVNVTFDDQVYTEVKTLIESTLDVRIEANLKSLGIVIISSYNQNDLQRAVEELQTIYYSLITSMAHQDIVRIVPLISDFNFEDLKSILSELYKVRVNKTNFFYVIIGDKQKVDQSKQLIEEIREPLQEKETYAVIQTPPGLQPKDVSDILSKVAGVATYVANQTIIVHGEKSAVEKARSLVNQLQITKNEDGTISIKCIDAPFKDVVVAIADKFGKSVAFAIPPETVYVKATQEASETVESAEAIKKIEEQKQIIEEKTTMTISLTSWEQFKKIVEEQYNYSSIEKENLTTFFWSETPLQIKINQDQSFSISCFNVPLYRILLLIAKELGISLVLEHIPQESMTLNVSSMNWEQFKKLIQEQYGYSYSLIERNTPMTFTKVIKQIKQVEIEARLIDRSLLDSLERSFSFGIGLAGTDTTINLTDGTLNITTNVISMFDYQKLLSLIPSGSVSMTANLNNSNNLDNLLASPRVVTSSGKEARILIGDRIPYQTVDAEGNVTVNFLDTGIELKITPYVRDDEKIELVVFIKVSKPTYYPSITIPGESTREAQTQVIMKNGDTLVIGGLIRETKTQTESKIPILGDLPFIGQLFRTKTDETDKRELVIFITAKVIER